MCSGILGDLSRIMHMFLEREMEFWTEQIFVVQNYVMLFSLYFFILSWLFKTQLIFSLFFVCASGLEWKSVFSKHLGNSPIQNSFIKSSVQHFPGKNAKIDYLCQIGKTQQVFQTWTQWFFQQRFLKAKI